MTSSINGSLISALLSHGFFRRICALCAACLVSAPLLAQDAEPPPGAPPSTRESAPAEPDSGSYRPRRNFQNPEAMMAALRERMGVTDDAEWALISTRIAAVFQIRRSLMGGFGGLGGGANPQGAGGGGSARAGAPSNPEMDALRAAVSSNLPDAEIKARLERLRAVRKQNEAKLDKAREDLRAVLTVRQEAVAVTVGLLN